MDRRTLLILSGIAVTGGVAGAAYLLTGGGKSAGGPTNTGATLTTASAPDALTAIGPDEQVLGKADAPVTLLMFESLTCGHCAEFHRSTFQALKTEFIETGKVKAVFRDFPLNAPALWASQLARCSGPERRWGLLDVLFATQQQWAIAPEPQAELAKTARLAGIDEAQFRACMGDQAGMQAMVARMDAWGRGFAIDSTPSFILVGRSGATRKIVGNQPIEAFRPVIAELAAEPARG